MTIRTIREIRTEEVERAAAEAMDDIDRHGFRAITITTIYGDGGPTATTPKRRMRSKQSPVALFTTTTTTTKES